ncbi:MAG: TetR/AcrR family transcriptional regulator [Bryobacteraceae bacterium]|nr:TetR/AcrR family transcriptional regulator [Bryobacteraceae bacterium]
MAKRKLKPEDLREACVAEALKIIGESGLEQLSLREVARRLNVSHQAPYRHFPSRDHILAEVVSRAFVAFADYLDNRPAGVGPAEDLANMGKAYLTYAQMHPLHYRLMFETQLPDPDLHPEMMLRARHAFALLSDAVARLPNRRADVPPLMDALFIWSTMHGLSSILRSHAPETLGIRGDLLDSVVPLVLQRISIALG